jgi:hypothetical protein
MKSEKSVDRQTAAMRNPGSYVSGNTRPHPSQPTFVVLGVGRGGTSIVVGMVAKLGIGMGAPPWYEDLEIRDITKKFPRDQWFEPIWRYRMNGFRRAGSHRNNPRGFLWAFPDRIADRGGSKVHRPVARGLSAGIDDKEGRVRDRQVN